MKGTAGITDLKKKKKSERHHHQLQVSMIKISPSKESLSERTRNKVNNYPQQAVGLLDHSAS